MKCVFYAAVLVLFANMLNAQEVAIDSVNPMHSSHNRRISKNFNRENDFNPNSGGNSNFVTVGLINALSGYFPVYYERKVLPWLGVQAGAGLTARDFFADGVNLLFVNGQTEYNTYYTYSERKILPGCYLSIQPKFYIGDPSDGFYLSTLLEYKLYNFKANMADASASTVSGEPVYLANKYFAERRNDLDFTFNLGWQWLFNNKVTLEYYMGVGFRRFWEHRLDVENSQPNNNYGTYYPYIFTNGTRNYNGWRPDFNICLSLGGFF